ncbi:hypothetical protein PSAB6_50051 [Paraburkholderia sabiae]|nr:hypothetical protein PSAB6_50051 [Paraburkholderia sabiae]
MTQGNLSLASVRLPTPTSFCHSSSLHLQRFCLEHLVDAKSVDSLAGLRVPGAAVASTWAIPRQRGGRAEWCRGASVIVTIAVPVIDRSASFVLVITALANRCKSSAW